MDGTYLDEAVFYTTYGLEHEVESNKVSYIY